MNRLRQFITEIHRRSLWQMLLIHVGGAWVCYEIIDRGRRERHISYSTATRRIRRAPLDDAR
jgi:hypothetical protein